MDFSDKVACVTCTPLFISLAERFARDFKRVYLHIRTSGSFVTYNQGMVGTGLADNLIRVDSMWDPEVYDETDLWIFPDLGHASLQVFLEEQGKRVWGARHGDELEEYREVCKKLMEEKGLPLAPWQVIKGMEALRAHLKNHDDQWVKLDKWRGLTETWKSATYELSEPKLDELEKDLGGFKDTVEFVVEDDLPDCVEIGLDCYCIDGQFPSKTLVGIEAKDAAYVAKFVDWATLPPPLTQWYEAMAPVLGQYGYRGFLSNELRIGEDQQAHMIDACARAGSPPSELYQEFYSNLSDIVWYGAEGILVDPRPIAKWGAQAVLKSKWAPGHFQPITIAPEWKNNLKLFNCIERGGQRYVIPMDEDMEEIGSVVGWGDTMQEAFEMVKQAGESVQGFGIKFSMGAVEGIEKEIEELDKFGVSPFGSAQGHTGSV